MRVGLYVDADMIGGAERSTLNLFSRYSGPAELVLIATSPSVLAEAARLAPERQGLLVSNRSDFRTRLREHRQLLRSLGLDLLQVTMPNPFTPRLPVFAARLERVPVVLAEHLVRPAARWRGRVVARAVSALAAQHVAVGERSAVELRQFFGLAEQHVTVVYNGVPEVADAPRRFESRPVVVCAARFEHQKQLDVLVAAMAMLPAVRLVLVGDGSLREALETHAEAVGVRDRVEFPGWVPDARSWIAGGDVFVLPSREEAFPLVIVEAMLSGVPVVATDVGSVSEAVVDGVTGYVVDPGSVVHLASAVQHLLADPARARAFGEAGRRRALERFTIERMVAGYDRVWRDVVEGRAGRPRDNGTGRPSGRSRRR